MDNPYSAPVSTASGASPFATASAGAVTFEMIEALRQTRPWVSFLAILGFIVCGFAVLGGLGMLVAGGFPGVGNSAAISPLFGLAYWAFVPFYFFPSLKLQRYSSAIRQLLSGGGSPALEEALRQQKGFWKLVGILTIAGIALYVVTLVGVFALAATHF